MKTTIQRLALILAMAGMGAGCTTAYDAYGYPRTVVEPGAAVLGAAAAGLVGYGIARSSRDRHYYGGHRHYARHRGHHYYRY